MGDSTFLVRFPTKGSGIRIALKDLIDLAGTVTTAGSPAVATGRQPATEDAECIRHIRQAEHDGRVRIVGKTNLHELAYGGDGINPHYGTPPNPFDSRLVPGGSSSGSAVAVATDEADIALGSDTGGSIRIPAACCGIVGLKTTWGRVPLAGVWPLAGFLDTIGPMARTCRDVITGMDLLQPGFAARTDGVDAVTRIGRVRSPGGFYAQPGLEEAVDAALRAAGIHMVDLVAPWWQPAVTHGLTALIGEANRTLSYLLDREDLLEPRISARIRMGASITDEALALAKGFRTELRRQMTAEMRSAGVKLLACPTMPIFPPAINGDATNAPYTMYTRPANLAGTPAAALPVPVPEGRANQEHRSLPGSMQIMGHAGSEELVMATALRIESALVG